MLIGLCSGANPSARQVRSKKKVTKLRELNKCKQSSTLILQLKDQNKPANRLQSPVVRPKSSLLSWTKDANFSVLVLMKKYNNS